jgi:hypothetical protein|tara:strand:+ start:555 stop:728 length:174 start_codon:yes stop_codon:yes gene_type:complete
MNINLTADEIVMIQNAIDCCWYDDKPTAKRGTSEADCAKRLGRKLAKALDHADTDFG